MRHLHHSWLHAASRAADDGELTRHCTLTCALYNVITGTFSSKKKPTKDKTAKLKQSSRGSAPELLRRGTLTKADIGVALPKLDKSGKLKLSSKGSAPQLLRRGTFTKADIGMAVPIAAKESGPATEYLEIAGKKGAGDATEYLEIAGKKGAGDATEYLEIAGTSADVAAERKDSGSNAQSDRRSSGSTSTTRGDRATEAAGHTSDATHTTQDTYATSTTPIRRTKRGGSSSSATAIERAVHRTALAPITENGAKSADTETEQVLRKPSDEDAKQFVLPRHCTGIGTARTGASRGNRKFSIVERSAGNTVVTL